MSGPIVWPEGKRFAFTVFDDADYDLLENTRPVYDFLAEIGLRTTKSVWTLPAEREAQLGGLSTADANYLAWAQSLQKQGFEIGFHGARCHTSTRDDIITGLDRFREQFGHDPATMSNHFQNTDSLYWGAARLSGLPHLIYRVANARHPLRCEGHLPGSTHFWGDYGRDRIRYLRNFVFREINTLKVCPMMPYSDPDRPFVNAWYASAEGGDIDSFIAMVSEKNQDQLLAEGGACIMYTHFAKGFFVDGKLDERFAALMRRLASLDGWFVPTGTLLDFLAKQHGGIHPVSKSERRALEWRWLSSKLRHGSS